MEKNWSDYSKEEKIKFLAFNTEDCTFSFGDNDINKIKSHKAILSNISPVFERMFNGDFKEAKSTDPISIEDISYDDFQQFLWFVYEKGSHFIKWKEVYKIAKKYLAETICAKIMSILKSDITPYNTLCLFEIMLLENEKLQLFTIEANGNKKYNNYFDSLKEAIDLPCSYIVHMDPNVFLSLINALANTQVSALKLFTVVDCYCAMDSNFASSNQKNYFVELFLNALDFTKISAKDFAKYVSVSDLLDSRKKIELLNQICK